jgi:hypothetical protein
VQYGDTSSAAGNFFADNIQVAGVAVTALPMGLGTSGSLRTSGIMGLSFHKDEFMYAENLTYYPTIIDTMSTQGLIVAPAYSLYLDDKCERNSSFQLT